MDVTWANGFKIEPNIIPNENTDAMMADLFLPEYKLYSMIDHNYYGGNDFYYYKNDKTDRIVVKIPRGTCEGCDKLLGIFEYLPYSGCYCEHGECGEYCKCECEGDDEKHSCCENISKKNKHQENTIIERSKDIRKYLLNDCTFYSGDLTRLLEIATILEINALNGIPTEEKFKSGKPYIRVF